MSDKSALPGLNTPPSAAFLTRGKLHRAIVACPPSTGSRGYDERVVFFEVPHSQPSHGVHLEELLSRVWCIDTNGWREDRAIYNINTYRELFDSALGNEGTGDLRLFEIGSGGQASNAIGPDRVRYARAADVELYVSPQTASRLRDVLDTIEDLYAEAAMKTEDH